jgi:monoamine oxidase
VREPTLRSRTAPAFRTLDSWVDDPWVHDSYAGFAPGQYTDFWGFLEQPEGNALFAGEHTSTHSQGHLNGGVETGERAARQCSTCSDRNRFGCTGTNARRRVYPRPRTDR